MKYIAIALCILTILPYLPNMALAVESTQDIEVKIGDWVILTDTSVINRTIILQGNLFIRGGNLTLINSTLEIKSYVEGQFGIEVENGELALYNSAVSSNIKENHYYIYVSSEGSFCSINSTIEYAGYDEGERSGLYVSGKLIMKNTTLRYNYYPLWAYGLSDTKISNTTIYGNSWGMRFVECKNIELFQLSISRNYRTGIWFQNGTGNNVKENRIERIWKPTKTSTFAQAILVDNETYDIIEDNAIFTTNREGILIKGDKSQENIVRNNNISYNGIASIHIDGAQNTFVKENNVSHAWIGIFVSNGNNNQLRENEIFAKGRGVKISNSLNTKIILGKIMNTKNYGIFVENSNVTYIYGVNLINNTYNLFIKDSVVLFGGHMYSDKYRLMGDARLYFAIWVSVEVYDCLGNPMPNIDLDLFFLGDKVAEAKTYSTGKSSFYAPYVLHTTSEKTYSWCEIVADRNHSFVENPIRFYPWETRKIVFRERAPGLDVIVFTDKREGKPGDMINITVIVENKTGYVDNASVDISLNGKPIFPPEPIGNGAYHTSVRLPEFNNSLKIEVIAHVLNQTGSAYTTIMKPSVPYNESAPTQINEEDSFFSKIVLGMFAVSVAVVILIFLKKKSRRKFDRYSPVPSDEIEIER